MIRKYTTGIRLDLDALFLWRFPFCRKAFFGRMVVADKKTLASVGEIPPRKEAMYMGPREYRVAMVLLTLISVVVGIVSLAVHH